MQSGHSEMEEHILLVDDDPRTCKVLDACLTD